MYFEFLEIYPYNEEVAQIGWAHYDEVTRLVFKAVRAQVVRAIPELKESDFFLKSNSHDFGGYYTIEVEDEKNEEYEIESEWPSYWDEASREYLEAECKKLIGKTYSEYMRSYDKEPYANLT